MKNSATADFPEGSTYAHLDSEGPKMVIFWEESGALRLVCSIYVTLLTPLFSMLMLFFYLSLWKGEERESGTEEFCRLGTLSKALFFSL
jgi:hypothetical protein